MITTVGLIEDLDYLWEVVNGLGKFLCMFAFLDELVNRMVREVSMPMLGATDGRLVAVALDEVGELGWEVFERVGQCLNTG